MLLNSILLLACAFSFLKGLNAYYVRPSNIPAKVRLVKNLSLLLVALQLMVNLPSELETLRLLIQGILFLNSLLLFWIPLPPTRRLKFPAIFSRETRRNLALTSGAEKIPHVYYASYVFACAGAFVGSAGFQVLIAPLLISLLHFGLWRAGNKSMSNTRRCPENAASSGSEESGREKLKFATGPSITTLSLS